MFILQQRILFILVTYEARFLKKGYVEKNTLLIVKELVLK